MNFFQLSEHALCHTYLQLANLFSNNNKINKYPSFFFNIAPLQRNSYLPYHVILLVIYQCYIIYQFQLSQRQSYFSYLKSKIVYLFLYLKLVLIILSMMDKEQSSPNIQSQQKYNDVDIRLSLNNQGTKFNDLPKLKMQGEDMHRVSSELQQNKKGVLKDQSLLHPKNENTQIRSVAEQNALNVKSNKLQTLGNKNIGFKAKRANKIVFEDQDLQAQNWDQDKHKRAKLLTPNKLPKQNNTKCTNIILELIMKNPLIKQVSDVQILSLVKEYKQIYIQQIQIFLNRQSAVLNDLEKWIAQMGIFCCKQQIKQIQKCLQQQYKSADPLAIVEQKCLQNQQQPSYHIEGQQIQSKI